MPTDFISLLKISRLMQIGLIAAVSGLGLLIWAGSNKVPPRAELKKVSGILAEGKETSKTQRKKGQSTGTVVSKVYELGLRQSDGQIRRVNLDGTWVSRPIIEAAMLKPMEVEIDEFDNVLVASASGRSILTYEASAKGYDIDNKKYRDMGAPMLVIGLPLLLLGWFWSRRGARKAVPASANPSM